jgi:arylsulfatase A-like enzyme
MDRLASEGVLFDQMFVTTAICAVSRASMLTGQHMARHGINSFEKPLSAEQWRQTYPMLLRTAGYRTAFLGKLAVGNPRVANKDLSLPADQFDFWYGFPQTISFRQAVDGKERYLTTVMEEKAAQFIKDQPKDQPFLLIMALKEPHGPLDLEDPEMIAPAQGQIPRPKTLTAEAFERLPADIRLSLNSVAPGPQFLKDEAEFQKRMAQCYRYIHRADMAVGRIMAALREQGFDQNTVVLFTSDNGSMEGAHRLVGKWNMYEESIRVPLIIRDPRLPAALRGRRSQMALNIDLAPTVLALAGIPIPTTMQGRDLQPVLRDPGAKGREDWYYEHDIAGFEKSKGRPLPRCEGVRTERWKYIRYKDTHPLQEELFDLHADPQEERNFLNDAKYAEMLAGFRSRCDAYPALLK